MTNPLLTLENIRSGAAPSDAVAVGYLLGEIERLREVLTIPNITPETKSSAMFIRTLSEHEKGQPVNTQDLINALMWRVRNQRKEIARLQAKRATVEPDEQPSLVATKISEQSLTHQIPSSRGDIAGSGPPNGPSATEPPVQPKNWAVWLCLIHQRIFAAHAGCSYCREGRAPTHDCSGNALRNRPRCRNELSS